MTLKQHQKLAQTTLLLLMVAFVPFTIPNSYADSGHSCWSPHCYAATQAKACSSCGFLLESGLKGTGTVRSITVPSGHGTANPIWVVFLTNEWVEAGWEKGSWASCGSNAVSTPRYYARDGVGTQSSYCDTTSTASGNPTFEVSDTNKDGTWYHLINGITRLTTTTPGYTQGYLKTGGESTHSSSQMDSKLSSLQYYGTSWTNWPAASIINQDSPYSVSWCSNPTSFAYGGTPTC